GIFVYLGFRQHKEKRPLLSQALLGGSVGVLMLTTFAAHYLYGFVNAPVAFVLNVLWVILGLRFSAKFHSQALGVLASAAGVLTPFLVQSDNPSSIFFVSFETILFVGFMTFAMRFDFEKLFYTSFALLHVALVFYGFAAGRDEEIIALGALAQHFILLASIFVQRNWMKLQLMALVTSFALTAVWFRIAMSSFWFENTMLLIFVAYAFLSLWFWKKDTEKLPYCLTVASYAVLFYTSAIVDHESLPAILLLEGLVALGLGFAVKSGIQKINGLIIYMIGGIGALVVLSEGMDEIFSSNMLIWLTLLLTLAGIAGLLSKFRLGGKTNERVKGLYYGIGALFLAFITDLTNALTHNLSNNTQHLSVSTAWVAYSIGVIAYGVMGSRKKVRLAGIALLFLTLMKVIFFDLPSVSVVIKAILFIGLGGIGVLLSRFFYKKE
ncbi:MAG: rane protein-like protein, partial [Paenibacillus sp.]|nr:rane protein-like protein [Paenibacillus sp.]